MLFTLVQTHCLGIQFTFSLLKTAAATQSAIAAVNKTPPMKPPLVPPTPIPTQEQSHATGMKGDGEYGRVVVSDGWV